MESQRGYERGNVDVGVLDAEGVSRAPWVGRSCTTRAKGPWSPGACDSLDGGGMVLVGGEEPYSDTCFGILMAMKYYCNLIFIFKGPIYEKLEMKRNQKSKI